MRAAASSREIAGSKVRAARQFAATLGLRLPEPGAKPRKIRSAKGSCLGDLGAHDRHPQQVGLELHQQVVRGGAAIDAQFTQRLPRVLLHGVQDLGALECDALERGSRDVRPRRSPRESDHRAARIGVPVRAAETGKRGHEIDATGVGHRGRKCLDLVRVSYQAEPVAQPLHDGAADENGAFEGVMPGVGCPGDRREETVRRDEWFEARIHEQEATGAVRILGHARLEACLAEQGRLLVASDTGDRHLDPANRRHRARQAKHRRHDLG